MKFSITDLFLKCDHIRNVFRDLKLSVNEPVKNWCPSLNIKHAVMTI